MAPDRYEYDDEMERRRRKRAALAKKKRLEQQRLRRKLILAAVILVLVVVLILTVTADKRDAADPTLPSGMEVPVFTEPPTEERATNPPDTPTTTIHIKAAGDLNVTDLVVASGRTNFGDDYFDYTQAFLDVAHILSNADLTVMNFEGNLVGPPYGTQTASAPQQLVEALDAIGVDILQMANSYSIHNGTIGLNQTLNNIRAAGIEPVGAYSTNAEFAKSKGYTICEVQGIKVALVAFTKGMGNLGLPQGSENCVNKLFVDYESEYRKIDRDGIRSILRAAASEKPDITIAMLHWGAEYNDGIFENQEEISELMLKEGVDVIIGTHPHMVHEIKFDEVNKTLIAYSLGDFFGDAVKGGTAYSIILDIEITRDNLSGTTQVEGYEITPIYTLSEKQGNGQRRVVRIDESIAAYDVNFVEKVTKEAYESMKTSLERIENRTATTRIVECPKCGEDLKILVNQEGKLVSDKTCSCGEVLAKDSNYSNYD